MTRIALILLIGLYIICTFLSCTKTTRIYECIECEVITEKGIPLDAKVYKQRLPVSIRESQYITDEYTLVLNNSIFDISFGDGVLNNPKELIFYPEFHIVAVPGYTIEQKKKYIEHENVEEDAFVVIKADTIFNKEEGKAIYSISYTDNQIKFNAFAKLKQYGDSVIIKLK